MPQLTPDQVPDVKKAWNLTIYLLEPTIKNVPFTWRIKSDDGQLDVATRGFETLINEIEDYIIQTGPSLSE